MSEQLEVTPEEKQVDEMANLVTEIRNEAKDTAIETAKTLLRKVLSGTPKSAVTEAVEAQSDASTRESAPYDQAGRTQPSHLRDSRYRDLGEQYTYRNADDDVIAQRWLQAVRNKDHVTLREMAATDRHARAPLAIGEPGANFGISNGTGGQLLPLPLANYLQTVVYDMAEMRALARVFDAGTGDSLRIPIQDAKSGNSWKAEAVVFDDGTPTAGDGVKLDLQKLTNLSDITDEMMDGSAFNVGSWLTMDVGEGMAEEEDIKFYFDGAGAATQEPAGLEASDTTVTASNGPPYYVPAAAQTANFTLPGVLDLDLLTDLYFALPKKHRKNAVFTCPDTVAALLSKLVDGNGRPILDIANAPATIVANDNAGGLVGTIFRRPVIVMPGNEGVGEDANRLYFSRMDRTFAILEKGGIRAESSRDFKFNQDLTTFKFVRRVDGQPIGNRTAGLPFDYVYSGNLT